MLHTGVLFETADEKLQNLYDAACRKCRDNLKRFGEETVLIEGGGYEKLWLETQPMGGEMYAKRDLAAAAGNIGLFMRFQRPDGRLPGSIERLKNGELEPQFNKFQGFCFPAPALNLYYWLSRDREYLDRLAECLMRFDEYLWACRDSDGDGLLESWCVYDTGEDNALRYGDAPNYCVGEEPPRGSAVVPMASMDFMSYSYACRDTLSKISRLRRDGQAAYWRRQAQRVSRLLRTKMWDEKIGACFDRDRNGGVIPVLCHNNLRCMYWGAFSQEMADRFVKEHLLNPDEFWTPLPLPSVAANDPAFRNAPENNWSGQPEGLTYQRAIGALERYGYEKVVTALGRKLLSAISAGGNVFTQQFDPFTGAPSRVGMRSHQALPPESEEPFQDSYGPTLLSALEYIAHLWGVHMQEGKIWFSLCSAPAPYSYEQQWGSRRYRIESDGRRARVYVNGKEKAQSPCGVRLIADANGRVLARRGLEDAAASLKGERA